MRRLAWVEAGQALLQSLRLPVPQPLNRCNGGDGHSHADPAAVQTELHIQSYKRSVVHLLPSHCWWCRIFLALRSRPAKGERRAVFNVSSHGSKAAGVTGSPGANAWRWATPSSARRSRRTSVVPAIGPERFRSRRLRQNSQADDGDRGRGTSNRIPAPDCNGRCRRCPGHGADRDPCPGPGAP